jgi:putative YhbY family RNA-binding protein
MKDTTLKSQAMSLKPAVIIGKQGLTENTIEQIRLHLKSNKMTKVKLSRNFLDESELDKKEIAKEIAEKTKSDLIQQVGFIAVYHKR